MLKFQFSDLHIVLPPAAVVQLARTLAWHVGDRVLESRLWQIQVVNIVRDCQMLGNRCECYGFFVMIF